VITVGATDQADVRPGYSNFGSCLDVFAPGALITSASIVDQTQPRVMSGTSMASPHVAGAAALLLGERPHLTPTEVSAQLGIDSTTGVVGNPGAGSPNRLLFVTAHGGSPPPPPDYSSLSPLRVFDTRPGTADGLRAVPKVMVGGGYVLEVSVVGVGGVPASGVGAVSLNVTATEPVAAGFVTVFPCGVRELVSSLNYGSGQTVANSVIAPVSASGSVCFFSSASTHLVVDVNGWFNSSA
jgi:subtilisin family serine protease